MLLNYKEKRTDWFEANRVGEEEYRDKEEKEEARKQFHHKRLPKVFY